MTEQRTPNSCGFEKGDIVRRGSGAIRMIVDDVVDYGNGRGVVWLDREDGKPVYGGRRHMSSQLFLIERPGGLS
ncbi:MAG: hypothetical protein J0J04_08165 [Microbacterium sp.]|uniref:hypothetical protein n=1 Tax=Microbacterium sp. TaxID=51671 RepID=UPI001ACA7925|nr:hypothetical protein [Microbacterium sp.]MBN9214775.1 hypothetical protein [Microbacterium sp.]